MKGRIKVEGKDGFKRISKTLENLPDPDNEFMKDGVEIVK